MPRFALTTEASLVLLTALSRSGTAQVSGAGESLAITIPLALGRTAYDIALTGANPALRTAGLTHVAMTVDGAPAHLVLAGRLFARVLATLIDECGADAFEPKQAGLLFETALTDQIEAVETQLGCDIAIETAAPFRDDSCDRSAPDMTGFAFNVAGRGDVNYEAALFLPEPAAFTFAKRVFGTGANKGAHDPETIVSLRVGTTTITEDQLRQLEPGDVLLLETNTLSDQRLLLSISEAIGTMLRLADRDHFLEGPFQSLTAPALRPYVSTISALATNANGKTAAGMKPQSGVAANSDRGTELFQIDVDLARTRLPMSVLETIDLDKPFDLPHDINGPVSLFVGDLRVAEGRLVRSSETVGVRIEQVNADE